MLDLFLLAWRDFVHDPKRLALWVMGTVFAVVLVSLECGFLNGLLDTQTRLARRFSGDLLITSSSKSHSLFTRPTDRRRVLRAAADPDVVEVALVYETTSLGWWRDRVSGRLHTIRILGVHPSHRVFADPELARSQRLLYRDDVLLLDRKARKRFHKHRGEVEVNDRRLHVAGHFSLGPDVQGAGTMIVSAQLLARIDRSMTPRERLDRPELALVHLRPGADREVVRRRLSAQLHPTVMVQRPEDYVERIRRFWAVATPIGVVFTIGAVLGVVVGVLVCYQLFSSAIADRRGELATLRAIGMRPAALQWVLLQQAIWLGLIGGALGLGLSSLMYSGVTQVAALEMELLSRTDRVVTIMVLAQLMTCGATLAASRELLTIDPAEVFG